MLKDELARESDMWMAGTVETASCCDIIIIIITDEYDLGGTVALLLQDHLTLLIVRHVTTNQSRPTTA